MELLVYIMLGYIVSELILLYIAIEHKSIEFFMVAVIIMMLVMTIVRLSII